MDKNRLRRVRKAFVAAGAATQVVVLEGSDTAVPPVPPAEED